MNRVPFRRAGLSWLAASTLLAGAGCLDDRGVGPGGTTARLAVRAQFGAAILTGIRLEGGYLRTDQSSVAFAPQTLPLPADRTPGMQATMPLSIDLAPCLADPLSTPGGGACTVTLALVLLDGPREVDRVVIGPLVLRPGEVATPAPVQLREGFNVDVVAPSTCVRPGETAQLTARLLDAAGAELSGRTFAWSSNAPAVATVGAATGLVTGVVPGRAIISATAGGRTGQIAITVCETARLVLTPADIAFAWYGESTLPDPVAVAVTNGEAGTLGGLTRGSVLYTGQVTNWLTATLSSTAVPATLTLRPSRSNLPEGTYTARVPVSSPLAANSPQMATVTYTVRDISNYLLTVEPSNPNDTYIDAGDAVSMRAVLLDFSEEEVNGVPVSWSVSPAGAGTFTPSSVTGAGAQYVAGSYSGAVEITATAGPLSATLDLYQNYAALRQAPGASRRSTATTPARQRAPGGTP